MKNTKTVTVTLKGQPIVWEWPAIPDSISRSFDIEVYDTDKRPDEFSLSINVNGCYEGFETFTLLHLLEGGIVYDFGAHLGWYSLLAASCGCDVTAYDENADALKILERSAKRNGYDIKTRVMKFDASTKPAPFKKEVEFLKADVEGAEEHVVRYCRKLFEKQLVKYALLEISPCFNDSYPALVKQVIDWGYDAFVMPTKPPALVREAFEFYVQNGLSLCGVIAGTEGDRLSRTHQDNWLFVRQ